MPSPKSSWLWRSSALAWRTLAGTFCFAWAAAAAPANYLVDKWDTEDSLPSSTVTSIEQTPDGYLWIGTYNGIARFDGTRFVTKDPIC